MDELRPLVDSIVDALIKSNPALYDKFNEFCSAVLKRDEVVKQMLEDNKIPLRDLKYYSLAAKYTEDVYRRLGNFVITAARVFKRRQQLAKKRTIAKRIRRQTAIDLLTYSAKLKLDLEQEAMDVFREYLEKLKEAEEEAKGEPEFEME